MEVCCGETSPLYYRSDRAEPTPTYPTHIPSIYHIDIETSHCYSLNRLPHYYFLDLTMLKVVKSNPTLMKMTTNKTDFKNKIFKINIIQQ